MWGWFVMGEGYYSFRLFLSALSFRRLTDSAIIKYHCLPHTSILHGRYPGMLLEITSEEGLIGEAKLIGYFLDAQIGGLQQGLYLEDNMTVYDIFGCDARYILHYGGKIARGDEQFGCIKGYFPLGGAIAVYQLDETLENFFLAADVLRFLLQE